MFKATDIQKLLACPQCKGSLNLEVFSEDELGIEQGKLTCPNCHKDYLIEDGVFHLSPELQAYNHKEGWSLSAFEESYEDIGYYESSFGWREKVGIPKLITNYDYPKVKGRLLEWLNPQDNDLILDAGAGVGYFIFEMIEKYKGRESFFVGMDVCRNRIRWLAYRSREERKSNVLAIVGDARNLPFQNGAFDIISCTEVLEHIPHKRQVINEISRCSKSGGRLVLSTPSKRAMDFWESFSRFYGFLRHKPKTNEDEGTYDKPLYPADLRRYLKDAGFSLLNFERNVILPPQGYFSLIPRPLMRVIVSLCGLAEKYMKGLFARWALHIVVQAQKKPG